MANYNGMFFWKKILDDENPYIDCPDDRWEMIEEFELSGYLDAGYDEGINCSSFRTQALQNAFDKRINELEEETGMNMSCPIRKSDCSDLRKKYGELSDHLLHPKCI